MIGSIVLISPGCMGKSDELWSESISDQRLAFVEARSDKGLYSGSFGDIVVLNLRTGNRRFVTDDSFLDEHVAFSPDGRSLAFCSAREGDRTLLRVQGVGAPGKVYLYDFETERIVRWGKKIDKERTSFEANYRSVQFSFDGGRIFLKSWKSIMAGDLQDDSIGLVKTFENVEFLLSISASPVEDVLAVKTSYPDNIVVYKLIDSSLHPVWESASAILGGWSSDGQRFLICDRNKSDKYEVMEYDLRTGSLTTVLSLENYSVRQCVYGQDSMFYAIASDSLKKDDILQYDRKTGSVEWLTNNGRDKRHLAIWRPPVVPENR